jgi:hypothetical protein
VADHVAADLERRADPGRSSDRAVFDSLLGVYGVVVELVASGRLGDEDRVRYVDGELHGLFSFLASGPPPRRLAELLALHRAGVVRFLGPDLALTVEDGAFVGRSGARTVRARAAVDARLPRTDGSLVTDPLVATLLDTGELTATSATSAGGRPIGGGRLVADGRARAVRADGSAHPRRFLLGPSVSGSAGAGGFSRPGFNGPAFRQNDAVARELLTVPLPARRVGTATLPHHPRAVPARPERPIEKEYRHVS